MSDTSEEKAMLEKVRAYFAKCPYLGEYAIINAEYLADKAKSYSINENAGYNPTLTKFMYGKEKQFLFTFDSKLIWNEDTQNNIDNSKFFENVRTWLESNNAKGEFPDISGAYEIGATTNGYIFATNAKEAIYRIQCYLYYSDFG